MSDWIEILKNRLENECLPLPENDWEWFEARFRQRRKRRLLIRWSAAAAGIAAAVGLLLLLKPAGESGIDVVQVPDSKLVSEAESTVDIVSPVDEPVDPGEHVYAPGTAKPTSLKPRRPAQEQVTIDEQAPVSEPDEPVQVREQAEPSQAGEPVETPKANHSEPTLWDAQESKQKKKISISPYAGGLRLNTTPSTEDFNKLADYTMSAASIETNYQNAGLISASPNDISSFSKRFSHSRPVSFGIDLSVPLTDRISVTSGADFTLYKSRVANGFEKISQKAYYLGIPLRLEWTAWENGPASVWLGAGGKVDHLVWGKIGNETLSDDSFHWSATGVAGIQYELARGLGLFFQPEISYYFKPSSPAILTYRTENPLMFSLEAGLRINL